MQAAAHGHDSIVGLLLEAGVPWNAIDKEGNCAGDLAVAAAHKSTAEMLLEAGTPHCVCHSDFHKSVPYNLCFVLGLWWPENGLLKMQRQHGALRLLLRALATLQ